VDKLVPISTLLGTVWALLMPTGPEGEVEALAKVEVVAASAEEPAEVPEPNAPELPEGVFPEIGAWQRPLRRCTRRGRRRFCAAIAWKIFPRTSSPG